jgi:hypothetical protein
MSSSDLVRLGGLAALAGAVLFAIFDVLGALHQNYKRLQEVVVCSEATYHP